MLDRDAERYGDEPLRGGECFERELHGSLVRADKTAGTEQNAAEVTGHHNRDFTDPAVKQHGKHGASRGAVRFAVITHSDLGGGAGSASGERPAVMPCVREFFPYLINKGFRFFGRCDMGRCADKAASLDGLLNPMKLPECKIRHRIEKIIRHK